MSGVQFKYYTRVTGVQFNSENVFKSNKKHIIYFLDMKNQEFESHRVRLFIYT